MPSGVPAPPGITRREDDAPRINVRPYGCLGEQNVTRQLPDRPGMRVPNVQRKASGPNARTAIVDPAGLYHIRGSGPDLAGAASRQTCARKESVRLRRRTRTCSKSSARPTSSASAWCLSAAEYFSGTSDQSWSRSQWSPCGRATRC
eukprot:TRINITY_DN44499_c0_g1_i1.p2 TRINITY_DN44499_c0_g1~~TRINITY_DN44499_c0_g1_i1.p2  ORF type:complete len:170 (+),score=3.38 TRINITY_DN44499_c0_g1_i1:72-512(+)